MLSCSCYFTNFVHNICNSKKEEPSHVLLALNKSLKEAHNSIRLSFSKDNTIEECDLFLVEFNRIIERIRG